MWFVWRALLNSVTLLHDTWNIVVWNLKRMGCLQFFFPHCQYIYLFFNKYIALEVRFVFVGHHYCIAIVYTIELSMRLTSFSKILEDIMNMSICTHRVLDCSYILLSYVWTMRWEVRVTQALTAYSHMYHVNHWRSRIMGTPRLRRLRWHRIPEYQRAPRQHDELHRDDNILLHRPSSSGVVPVAIGNDIMDRNVLRGDHLWSIRTQ